MCLAIPGMVKSIDRNDPQNPLAQVLFGAVVREISLSCLPDAKEGDYVIAHAGVALQTIDEEEAAKILEELAQLERVN